MFEAMGNTHATRLVTDCTEAMSLAVRQSGGMVVKVLGDGILAVFERPEAALSGARGVRDAVNWAAKQRQLHAVLNPKLPTAAKPARSAGANDGADTQFSADTFANLCVNIGVEHGDVVSRDEDGQLDVFGDAVNVAARLSDVAQNGEILVGEGAYAKLDATWRMSLRSLSRIALKGKAQAMAVWRLELLHEMQTGPHAAYTMHVGSSNADMSQSDDGPALLRLHLPDGSSASLHSHGANLTLGRTRDADVMLDDPRVSRTHATLAWQTDHFTLTDISSNGTWLRFGGTAQVHTLRRSNMPLVGSGEIGLGAHLSFAPEVTVRFTIDRLGEVGPVDG